MPLTANTQFEIRTTGNDTNGGGFAIGASGVDRSQQDNPQYAVTDGVTNGTTTITSATANFGTDVVGNVVYIAGGTGSIAANWYSIVSRTNSTTIVVDRSTGLTSGTGVTLRIGGALRSIGTMGAIVATGQVPATSIAWVRSGTYTLTTSTLNVSGGPYNDGASRTFAFIGYGTSRGDYSTNRPVISTGSLTSVGVFYISGYLDNGTSVINIEVDGVSPANNNSGITLPSGTGSSHQNTTMFIDCVFRNLSLGIAGGTGNATGFSAVDCTAINCGTYGFGCTCHACIATGCLVGFQGHNSYYTDCIAAGNTSHGFSSTDRYMARNCLAVSNGGAGFTAYSGYRTHSLYNCLSAYNTNAGYSLSVGGPITIYNCASYANGVADSFPSTQTISTAWRSRNLINNLTADPFVNRAGGDYRLNDAIGGGALLKNAGLIIPTQVASRDIGAMQAIYGSGGGGGGLRLPRPMNGGYSA